MNVCYECGQPLTHLNDAIVKDGRAYHFVCWADGLSWKVEG